MDRGAWWATGHGGHRESDMTEATVCVCMWLHISGITQYLSFCACLMPLSIIVSRFIYNVAIIRISVLVKTE